MGKASAVLGWLTGLALLGAAIGKIAAIERFSTVSGWALIEPIVAAIAICSSSSPKVRFFFGCLFLSFASYILMLPGGLQCRCFGVLTYFAKHHIFVFDMVMCFCWFAIFLCGLIGQDRRRVRVSLAILFSICATACAFGVTYLLRGSGAFSVENTTVGLKGSTSVDLSAIKESNAVFFARTQCAMCILKLRAFERYCSSNGLVGVVALPSDALKIPQLKTNLRTIRLEVNEAKLAHLPSAFRIDVDGKIIAVIELD